MNKMLKISTIIVATILAVVILLLIGLKVGEKLRYIRFYTNAEKEFRTPGISDNLVQQGMVYIDEKERFLVCGYMSDNTASRVYVLDRDGNVLSITQLKNADGSDYTGHTGGMEYYENHLYITEGTKEKGYDGGLVVFPLDQILAGNKAVGTVGRFKTYNNPAYCHIYNGYILIGEYYRAVDYETADEHRMRTPADDQNTALITVFKLDNSAPFGIGEKPLAGITTTDGIQGLITIEDKQIVTSSSWGLSSSTLRFYDMDKITHSAESVTIGENTMTIYHLDSASLVKEVEAPPMAEEMVYLDGKIFILSESACNKYIYGKFMSGNYLYSYIVDHK